MHSDKKRCADTLSLSRQAEQNRAEERVSIDTKKGSKYNKSNEKRGGGIQLKKRKWKFRIAGGAVTLLGIYLMAVGYGETITLTIATVVLIFGIAIWSMATPESYNSIAQIDKPCEIYNDLHHYTIYAVDQDAAEISALFAAYMYINASFEPGQKVKQSYTKCTSITLNKTLKQKYNPDFKETIQP